MDIDDEMVSDMCLDGTVLHDGLCRFTFSTPWLQILMGSFVPIRGVVGSLDGFLKTLLSWIVFIFNRCREPTSPEIILISFVDVIDFHGVKHPFSSNCQVGFLVNSAMPPLGQS